MDRISYLRQKANRGTLTLSEMQELVQAMENLPNEIKTEIKRNLRQYKQYYEMLFEKKYFDNPAINNASDTVLAPLKRPIAEIQEQTSTAMNKLLKYGISAGVSNQDLGKSLVRNFRVLKKNSETVANTARLALIRSDSLNKLIQSGAKYFKYVGPRVGLRKFCATHIDRIYTLEEIRQMDNGQGLPVEHYCGGYNCRHRWVAVSEAEYLQWKLLYSPSKSNEWQKKEPEEILQNHD